MARLRINFITGTLGASLGTGGTTITFNAAPNIGNISAPNYLPLVISPSSYGVVGTTAPEIVWITSYTAGSTTATISRAQEGTSSPASWPIGTVWANSPTVSDFDVTNLTSSGTLTLNNGLNVGSGGLNVTAGNANISGNLTVTGGTTVLGSLGVAGNFNANGTSIVFPSGSLQVAGNITTNLTLQATTITGTTVNVGNTLTVGNAINAAGEIYANNTGTAISAPNGNVVVGGNIVANGNITASGAASNFTSYATAGNTGFYTQFGNAVIGGLVQATTITGTTVNVGNTLTVGNAINVGGNLIVSGSITNALTRYSPLQVNYVPSVAVNNIAAGTVPSNPNWVLCNYSIIVNPSGTNNTFISFPTSMPGQGYPIAYGYPIVDIGSATEAIVSTTTIFTSNGFYVDIWSLPGGSYASGNIRLNIMIMAC